MSLHQRKEQKRSLDRWTPTEMVRVMFSFIYIYIYISVICLCVRVLLIIFLCIMCLSAVYNVHGFRDCRNWNRWVGWGAHISVILYVISVSCNLGRESSRKCWKKLVEERVHWYPGQWTVAFPAHIKTLSKHKLYIYWSALSCAHSNLI